MAAASNGAVPLQMEPHNFVPEAGLGCHICHFNAPWIIGVRASPFDSFLKNTSWLRSADFPSCRTCRARLTCYGNNVLTTRIVGRWDQAEY
eukprot:1195270-Prorocentrum_minimum.AAC.3